MLFYVKILILVKVLKNRLLVLGLFFKILISLYNRRNNFKKQREVLLLLSSTIILKYFEKKVNNLLTCVRQYVIIDL